MGSVKGRKWEAAFCSRLEVYVSFISELIPNRLLLLAELEIIGPAWQAAVLGKRVPWGSQHLWLFLARLLTELAPGVQRPISGSDLAFQFFVPREAQ